jgi:hypothetical protein
MKTDFDRLVEKFEINHETGCWEWTAALVQGYGQFQYKGKRSYRAHRAAYIELVEPVPDELQMDHLCRNRRCINPDHLEPVTPAENVRRAWAVRPPVTHCKRGHEFTPENTYWGREVSGTPRRQCRDCRLTQRRERLADAA